VNACPPGHALANEAAQINEAHRLARQHAESAVQYAIRCGELLAAKKAELKHGEFKPWIAANCEFSYQSAHAYMKAAQQKSRGLDFLSLAQALDYDKPAPEVSPIASGTPRKEQQAQLQKSVEIYAQTRGITSEPQRIREPAPKPEEPAAAPLKTAPDQWCGLCDLLIAKTMEANADLDEETVRIMFAEVMVDHLMGLNEFMKAVIAAQRGEALIRLRDFVNVLIEFEPQIDKAIADAEAPA